MKKIKTFLNCISIICVISALFCTCANNQPEGKAVLTGKITGAVPAVSAGDSVTVSLSVPNPVLGENDEYETRLKPDGTFAFIVPVISPKYAAVNIAYGEDAAYVLLSPDKETRMEIFLDEAGKTQIKTIQGTVLTREDMNKLDEVNREVLSVFQVSSNYPNIQLDTPPNAYRDSMLIWIEKDLSIVKNSAKLTEELKQLQYSGLKLVYLANPFFDYESQMRLLYLNQHLGENVSGNDITPATPDKSYYTFLQYFDLNNPPYMDPIFYPIVLQSILDNKTLNIPLIKETQVNDWLKETKAIMAELIGTDTGLFYDMLAARAYVKQFKDELNPLSDKQKQNIESYFKNPSFADILFAENESIIEELKGIEANKDPNAVYIETPSVPKEELMNAIVSKYKGKTVLVDLWATWCGPCLDAMKKIKGLKEVMADKKVVFVYITDTSSPDGLWKKKMSQIGGEHYYLTNEEWNCILDNFKIKGIPTYLLFDSQGVFKNKITGYPGNEEMQKMIEELLP